MWSGQSGSRRGRRAARGKEELLRTAATVVAQRGLEHTRFADVSSATGVAISTLQYYFGSREDLLIAVIEYAMQEELHQLHTIVAEKAPADQRLESLIARAVV